MISFELHFSFFFSFSTRYMALELLQQYLCLHYYLDVQHCMKLGHMSKVETSFQSYWLIPQMDLIRIDHNSNSRNCCEPDIFRTNSDNIAVELKSPYPQPDKIPVHYSVPKWYILQILSHMFITGSEYCWYGCCGPQSVVLIACTFDEDLWNKIWTEIKNFLDKRKPAAAHWPKHIVSELRDNLGSYIENYTDLIGEVPIVMMV